MKYPSTLSILKQSLFVASRSHHALTQAQDEVIESPAHFRVSNTVINENPGAFTFTSEHLRGNRIFFYNFEPFAFRPKLYATKDSPDQLHSEDWELSDGNFLGKDAWAGGKIRVYCIENGQLVHKRSDTIERFVNEKRQTPRAFRNSETIPLDQTEIAFPSINSNNAE